MTTIMKDIHNDLGTPRVLSKSDILVPHKYYHRHSRLTAVNCVTKSESKNEFDEL